MLKSIRAHRLADMPGMLAFLTRPVAQVLTGTHDDLRRGVRYVCARFPNEYWRDLDAERRYPEEFVRAMTESRLPRRADPRRVRRDGPRPLRRVRDPGGGQQERRQRRPGPRPDVHHGHAPQARLRGTKADVPAEGSHGQLRLQAFGVTEPEAGTDTTSIRPRRRAKATTTWSTGARSTSPGSSSRTS